MLLSHVDHPNVMRCLFTGTSPEGAPFIVTPQLATVLSAVLPKSLDDVGWCARHSQVKQWPLTRAVRCGVQLGRALRHCHHFAFPGHVLLHRDLKPDNIGLMADDSVKLFDFGLSKIVPIESRGGKGPKLTGQTGSLRYMAPEVCLEKPYDESADVYSFAVILWQMASHDVPFVGMGGLGGFVERVAGRPAAADEEVLPAGAPGDARELLARRRRPAPVAHGRRPAARGAPRRARPLDAAAVAADLDVVPRHAELAAPRQRRGRPAGRRRRLGDAEQRAGVDEQHLGAQREVESAPLHARGHRGHRVRRSL